MRTTAEQIVAEVRTAAEAVARLGEHVTLSVVLEDQTDLVREVAALAQGEVVTHSYRPADSAMDVEITSARWQVGRVHLTVQAATSRLALPTCSECKGPLEDDEALFGPDGKARCSNCSEKDEDEAPPYRGNVCAEERAIDAGIGGRQ